MGEGGQVSIESMYAEAALSASRREPEAQSFIALAQDEAVARELGPELMRREYPGRVWGEVIRVEQLGDGLIEVVVQDKGSKR